MTTAFPSLRPKESEWLKFIGISSRFNLSEVNDSIQGKAIKLSMQDCPFETISMIQDMLRDDQQETEKIIGTQNLKLLL